jgi:hypothetical protein
VVKAIGSISTVNVGSVGPTRGGGRAYGVLHIAEKEAGSRRSIHSREGGGNYPRLIPHIGGRGLHDPPRLPLPPPVPFFLPPSLLSIYSLIPPLPPQFPPRRSRRFSLSYNHRGVWCDTPILQQNFKIFALYYYKSILEVLVDIYGHRTLIYEDINLTTV